jgi:glyoxylase-like metal-dependent hydrolase (beta-lactamase superfamily II)
VDFPGGNPEQMYYSLTQKMAALPDDTILFPGHNCAQLTQATIGEQKKTNPYLKYGSLKQFLAAMGFR